MNIFAIVDDEASTIRRIPVTGSLQDEIDNFFGGQKDSFCSERDKVDFTGSYNVADGEIFRISDYPIKEDLINSLRSPLNCDRLNLGEPNCPRAKALFAGEWNDNKYICFQVLDSRKMLSRRFTLLNSGDTYTKLESPGIILQDKLTAIFEENELLFYSYHNTRRFLDLSDYYREATDTDLEAFADNDLFEVADKDLFKRNADSIIRKKIALLQKNNVLDNLSIDDISQTAQEYNVSINTRDGKIIIPGDKKQLKELVRFLDEDYGKGPLTHRKYITNSKQYLPR